MARSAMPNPGESEVVVTSAARTASGNSGPLPGWGAPKTLRCQLDVTAVSGVAPTLDVLIEDTIDGTNYNTIGTFTQATAVSRQVVNVTLPFTDTLRVRWTTAGTTPSFTFSVSIYSEA